MALAALASLGRRSAHSFPIGPVMAEPEQKHGNGKSQIERDWKHRLCKI